MASKLLFILLAAAAILAMVAAERGEKDNAFARFMRGFLDRRGSCVKECQKGCGGRDSNCCMFKNTGKRGRCRTVKTWPYYEYMCIHPDFHYITTDKVAHNDCNLPY